jgi:hypothetical protein
MTTWYMRVACWIPKATNTHTDFVTLVAFPRQQWLHERASLLRYTYTACIVEHVIVKNLLQGWDHDNHLATNCTEVIRIYVDSIVKYL